MRKHPLKLLAAFCWIFLLCALLFDGRLRSFSFAFCDQHRWQAPLLLMAAQSLFASLALPCSPIAALAGMLWGVRLGFFYSIMATLAASVWTFLLGRYVVRGYVAKMDLPHAVRAVAGLIERHGWKAVALAYANPVIPGSSLGYLFGATTISLPSFTLGMLVGTLPLQFALVMFGRSLVKISLTWFDMVMLAATLIAILLLARPALGRGRRFWQAMSSTQR